MNKYVQWLSFTQRKHCLGTGQLTAVGSHEILKYHTYKIQTEELRVFENWIQLALFFADIFAGAHCGHQLLNSFPFQWATDPALLSCDNTALTLASHEEKMRVIWVQGLILAARFGMPGHEYGANIYQVVLDKGQGCDWVIQSWILVRSETPPPSIQTAC